MQVGQETVVYCFFDLVPCDPIQQYHLSGVMVSVLTLSAEGGGFGPSWVKPKTFKTKLFSARQLGRGKQVQAFNIA